MTRDKSIDWLLGGITINPFTGCENSCDFCYARRMARRLSHVPGTVYHVLTAQGHDPFTPAFNLHTYRAARDRLARFRQPRRIFIGSMGEIGSSVFLLMDGARFVRTAGIEEIMVMLRDLFEDHVRHTFLMLTKQPQRLPVEFRYYTPNLQLGVSVTGVDDTWRIDILCQRVPTVVRRWVSFEPLLSHDLPPEVPEKIRGLDWIVVGAQTGPGATVAPDIVEVAKTLCILGAENKVPVFVKENLCKLNRTYPWPREILP